MKTFQINFTFNMLLQLYCSSCIMHSWDLLDHRTRFYYEWLRFSLWQVQILFLIVEIFMKSDRFFQYDRWRFARWSLIASAELRSVRVVPHIQPWWATARHCNYMSLSCPSSEWYVTYPFLVVFKALGFLLWF